MEEHNRLLYVALTRAEDRLVVCGWQTPQAGWTMHAGIGWWRAASRRCRRGARAVRRLGRRTRRHATPQIAEPEAGGEAAAGRAGRRPAALGRRGARLARRRRRPPNRRGRSRWRRAGRRMSELGPVPAAASPLAAREAANNRFRRGTLIHALLQHLPDLPPRERAAAALRLARPARQRPAGRRGRGRMARRDAGDPRPSRSRAAVRAGQPRRGAADRPGRRRRWSAGWWTGWRCWPTAC